MPGAHRELSRRFYRTHARSDSQHLPTRHRCPKKACLRAHATAGDGESLLAVSDLQGVEDVAEAYRAAGIWIEPFLDANRDKIAALSDWFTVSCVLLATEVILWTVSVAG